MGPDHPFRHIRLHSSGAILILFVAALYPNVMKCDRCGTKFLRRSMIQWIAGILYGLVIAGLIWMILSLAWSIWLS